MKVKRSFAAAILLALAAMTAPAFAQDGDERGYLFTQTPFNVDVNGWMNGGFMYNSWESPDSFNGPVSFADRDDELQLNQAYLVVERETDTSEQPFDIGGRFDFLYGTDGRFTKALGLELNQDGTPGLNAGRSFYHMAFPQFYVDMAMGPLTVRAGHFYTIVGYESVMAPNNFFYTHAYTMQYGEPFTHTGLLTKLEWGPLTFYNGITNQWDTFTVANTPPTFTDRGAYLGGYFWEMFDGLVSGGTTYTLGNEYDQFGIARQRNFQSNIMTVQLTDFIQWVGQTDLGYQRRSDIGNPELTSEWYGFLMYVFIDLTDSISVGSRSEMFRDDDGFRVNAVGVPAPGTAVGNSNLAQGPYVGNFYEQTFGLNWKPNPNVVIRPEMRWDWYGPSFVGALPTGQVANGFAYNGATRNSQFTMGIDAILLW